MTEDLVAPVPLPNLDQLFAAPSQQFKRAQAQLENSRRALVQLQASGDTTAALKSASSVSVEQHLEAICGEIDNALVDTAWRLTTQRANNFTDLIIKARYAQEFVQFDVSNLESQIVLSLCQDLTSMVGLLLSSAKSD